MKPYNKLTYTTAVVALSLSIGPAFAQSGTGAEGSPGGAGHNGDSGTGAPLTGASSTTTGAPMTGQGSMMKSGAAPSASTTTENKPTATGGQPGGDATRGK